MLRFLIRHRTAILWLTIVIYVVRQTSLFTSRNEDEPGVSVRTLPAVEEPQLYFHGVPVDEDEQNPVQQGYPEPTPRQHRHSDFEHLTRASVTTPASRSVPWHPTKERTHKHIGSGGPRMKVILYWTKYFRSDHFQFGFGQWPFIHHNCPVDTCTVTNDKGKLADADVIVFHGPLIKRLPDVRHPHQIYVFVQKEPWIEKSNKTLSAFNNVMNLTMTYRIDSDIVLPYGIVFRNESSHGHRQPVVDPLRKRRSIVWPVSHCETESQREVYAKELGKHIDIDVYGECGRLQCPKEKNPECWALFERDYRFLLAFENHACRDYVTEKAYRPLAHNIVPIVYGGADYRSLLPKKSFIDVRDYPDPRSLARYLKYLSHNKTAYNEYFRWKDGGYQVETYKEILMANAFCRLCEIVHDKHYKYRKYKDLRKWWVHGACDNKAMDKLKAFWSKT